MQAAGASAAATSAASWVTLSRTLVQLETECRSAKPLIRYKAIERLNGLIDTRDTELVQLLGGSHPAAETNWLSLVDSVHEACQQQAARLQAANSSATADAARSLQTIENKTGDHSTVLRKLVTLANRDAMAPSVAPAIVLDKAVQSFDNAWMVRYFGTTYLQILYENVLQPMDDGGDSDGAAASHAARPGMDDVKSNDWNSEYEGCGGDMRSGVRKLTDWTGLD